jgi:hypothetical protein
MFGENDDHEPPETGKKYDAAISFLVQDAAPAQSLYDKLSDGLRVFFFPRSQEDLAGTDGLESMRVAIKIDSFLNVVLYRERFGGNTPWTAAKAAAVRDSCLATGFRSLFFFVVEPTKKLPDWLPDSLLEGFSTARRHLG